MTEVRVFQCPSCHQFINTGMNNCKFCHALIDPQTALEMSTLQYRVDSACNHASLTRNLAGTMVLSFFMRYIPLIGLMFAIVFLVTLVATPIQLVIWQAKHAGLQTADSDYQVAKQNIRYSLIAWAIMFLVALVFTLLIFV